MEIVKCPSAHEKWAARKQIQTPSREVEHGQHEYHQYPTLTVSDTPFMYHQQKQWWKGNGGASAVSSSTGIWFPDFHHQKEILLSALVQLLSLSRQLKRWQMKWHVAGSTEKLGNSGLCQRYRQAWRKQNRSDYNWVGIWFKTSTEHCYSMETAHIHALESLLIWLDTTFLQNLTENSNPIETVNLISDTSAAP